MAKILVLNGPNLNLLGTREPEVYGHETLADIETRLTTLAQELGSLQLAFLQSNAEATLIDRIHACLTDGTDFILINPAAFTHTSIALRDALLAVNKPFLEIHLSNIHAREPFRQQSVFSDIAFGCITGLGHQGYELGLRYAHTYLLKHLETGAKTHYGYA